MHLSRQARIKTLLALDVSFFLVEIIVGYWINSLAIIADSFHMLNDILSLVVALYALKLASKTTFPPKYSYGWQRAEILGALVNGVFLMALCFSIFIESIERFFNVAEIERSEIIIGIGCAGLLSNLIGLLLFHEHGHGHNHKNHSHGDTVGNAPIDEILVHPAASRHSVVKAAQEKVAQETEDSMHSNPQSDEPVIEEVNETPVIAIEKGGPSQHVADDKERNPEKQHDSQGGLNMRGVFLHVLGDALSNIGVVATGLFIYLTHLPWRFYADPFVSLILTVIIFSSAWPLVKSASFILLQGVPSGIPLDDVRSEIKMLPGVLSVHELHIWQLSDTKRIGSVHVLLAPLADYMEVAIDIRRILHVHGVHSITIQPEFVKVGLNGNDSGESVLVVESLTGTGDVELVANEGDNESACLLRCNLSPSCTENLCCPPKYTATEK